MVAAPPMSPSMRKLSEVARHVVIPSGVVTTGWPAVQKKAAELGVAFPVWQHGLGRVVLGKRADGIYAATVGGITLSIPRQVAKTFFVGRLVFVLCILFPGLKVLWTAHRTRTATSAFKSLQAFARKPKVAVYLKDDRSNGLRTANGEQEIAFANGSIIMFGARESGFGRGFENVDIEVFDEAQILTERALEDMVAATNQSLHPHGALLFYMGTPPRPVDPGDVFKARRADALSGESEDSVYVECSADVGADPDDRKQWEIANPSYPDHTPLRSMLRLRKNLVSVESWLREGLGIWDDDATTASPIPPSKWAAAECAADVVLTNPVVAVDLRTGLEQSLAIVVAGRVDEDRAAVDVARYELGVNVRWAHDFAVSETKSILDRHGLDSVVVDKYGEGNGVLIPLLVQAGIRVVELNIADMRSGTVGFVDAVVNKRLLHKTTPVNGPLSIAVAGAVTKPSQGGFLWAPNKAFVDLVPLRAATAAWWVLHSTDADYDVLDSFF